MTSDKITAATKAIVRERSGDICEVCRAATASNFHHRKPRGMGGSRLPIHGPEWLLHLCGTGTTGCHGHIESHPELSYSMGWKIRGIRHPRDAPVCLQGQWYILLPDGGTVLHRWTPAGWTADA